MKTHIRISRAVFDPKITDEVVSLMLQARGIIWPKQEKLAGYVDGYIGVDRQNGSMVWVTFWDSVEHGNALGALPEMISTGAHFVSRGLKFDPITNHEMIENGS